MRRYEYVTKTKGIPLPSLFPMAHKPFLQYLAVPAKILRERVDETETKEPMYTITFVPDGTGDIGTACGEHDEWFPDDYHTRGRGRVKIGGGWAWTWRCK
jgi:hypothetical protein